MNTYRLYSVIGLLITTVVQLWTSFIINYMDFLLRLCELDYMDVYQFCVWILQLIEHMGCCLEVVQFCEWDFVYGYGLVCVFIVYFEQGALRKQPKYIKKKTTYRGKFGNSSLKLFRIHLQTVRRKMPYFLEFSDAFLSRRQTTIGLPLKVFETPLAFKDRFFLPPKL